MQLGDNALEYSIFSSSSFLLSRRATFEIQGRTSRAVLFRIYLFRYPFPRLSTFNEFYIWPHFGYASSLTHSLCYRMVAGVLLDTCQIICGYGISFSVKYWEKVAAIVAPTVIYWFDNLLPSQTNRRILRLRVVIVSRHFDGFREPNFAGDFTLYPTDKSLFYNEMTQCRPLVRSSSRSIWI